MSSETKSLPKGEDGGQPEYVPKGLGYRHLQLALLFSGIAISYSQRINLSICIVDMTAQNSTRGFPVYDWSQSQRGLVLSAFFWGYVLMQVPSGMLSQRFGPKRFILVGVVGSSALTLLTPLAAALGGWRLLCALRMMEGLCQGLVYPASHTMLGRWVPPVERGRAGPMVYSGFSFGTVSMMAGAGVLAGSPLGWPAGFYVPGVIGILWGFAVFFLAANSPNLCKRISPAERDYINRGLGSSSSGEKRHTVPWKSILTSIPVLSLMAAHCAQNFGHWMMLTQMPNYLKEALHFEITKNGLTSAMPYLGHFTVSWIVGYFAQMINERQFLSIGTSRKMFNSIGQYGGGVAIFILAFAKLPPTVAVVMLIIIVSLEAGILAGYGVNHVDLSPNFSGPLMGLTNGVSNLMGIIAPIFVSVVLGDTNKMPAETVEWRWSIVFAVAGVFFICGNTLFLCGGSGEVQQWNTPQHIPVPTDEPDADQELLEKDKDAHLNGEPKQVC